MPGRSLTEEMYKAVSDNDKGDCKARSDCAKVFLQILEQQKQPKIDELPLSAITERTYSVRDFVKDDGNSNSKQIQQPHYRPGEL